MNNQLLGAEAYIQTKIDDLDWFNSGYCQQLMGTETLLSLQLQSGNNFSVKISLELGL